MIQKFYIYQENNTFIFHKAGNNHHVRLFFCFFLFTSALTTKSFNFQPSLSYYVDTWPWFTKKKKYSMLEEIKDVSIISAPWC